jgi:hypothetical protein
MSKAKPNNDPRYQFFPGKKRQVTLQSWAPKRNTENEKRVLFKFKMPITGQSFVGFPEFLTEGHHAVEKEGSGGVFGSDVILEAMALDFYATDKSPDKVQRAAGLTLQGFELSREKEGDSYATVLRFEYNVPWHKNLWRFIDTYWGMTLWVDFEPSPDYVPSQDDETGKQMRLGDKDEEKGDGMPHQTKERGAAVREM